MRAMIGELAVSWGLVRIITADGVESLSGGKWALVRRVDPRARRRARPDPLRPAPPVLDTSPPA